MTANPDQGRRTLRFDLHVHTREGSRCAMTPAAEAVRLADRQGLDGIVFTDHHFVWPEADLDRLRSRVSTDIVLLSGQELTFQGLDFLVFGWNGDLSGFTCKADLVTAIRAEGGAVVLAHPFSALYYMDPPAIAALRTDGVEIFNTLKGGPTPSERTEIRSLGMAETGGSDFHQPILPDALGDCWTEIGVPVKSVHDLVRAIRQGNTAAYRS